MNVKSFSYTNFVIFGIDATVVCGEIYTWNGPVQVFFSDGVNMANDNADHILSVSMAVGAWPLLTFGTLGTCPAGRTHAHAYIVLAVAYVAATSTRGAAPRSRLNGLIGLHCADGNKYFVMYGTGRNAHHGGKLCKGIWYIYSSYHWILACGNCHTYYLPDAQRLGRQPGPSSCGKCVAAYC